MKTIDELWYGNISPFEQCTRGDKRLKELLKLVARNREELDGTFITCQRSVPEAIVCFLESTSFEDAVRNAVSLGGDADTQGAITGSMAEAYYGVPIELEDKALTYLTPELEGIYHAFRLVKGKRAAR